MNSIDFHKSFTVITLGLLKLFQIQHRIQRESTCSILYHLLEVQEDFECLWLCISERNLIWMKEKDGRGSTLGHACFLLIHSCKHQLPNSYRKISEVSWPILGFHTEGVEVALPGRHCTKRPEPPWLNWKCEDCHSVRCWKRRKMSAQLRLQLGEMFPLPWKTRTVTLLKYVSLCQLCVKTCQNYWNLPGQRYSTNADVFLNASNSKPVSVWTKINEYRSCCML